MFHPVIAININLIMWSTSTYVSRLYYTSTRVCVIVLLFYFKAEDLTTYQTKSQQVTPLSNNLPPKAPDYPGESEEGITQPGIALCKLLSLYST